MAFFSVCTCQGNESVDEIFTTKIKTFVNLERFTKFLCHENLELYGNQPSRMCQRVTIVVLLVCVCVCVSYHYSGDITHLYVTMTIWISFVQYALEYCKCDFCRKSLV